jgi:uncharacterized membrane protein
MTAKSVARAVLAVFMIAIGVVHFAAPDGFVQIVPKSLPAPLLLVYVSGAFEILGGVGILVPRTRRLAGYGLVALYLAVFPANINMAVNHIEPVGTHIPEALFWLRLPLQIVLVMWALWCTRRDVRASEPRAETPI